MLHPELCRALEDGRWTHEDDVGGEAFDGSLRSDEQAGTSKSIAPA